MNKYMDTIPPLTTLTTHSDPETSMGIYEGRKLLRPVEKFLVVQMFQEGLNPEPIICTENPMDEADSYAPHGSSGSTSVCCSNYSNDIESMSGTIYYDLDKLKNLPGSFLRRVFISLTIGVPDHVELIKMFWKRILEIFTEIGKHVWALGIYISRFEDLDVPIATLWLNKKWLGKLLEKVPNLRKLEFQHAFCSGPRYCKLYAIYI